MYVIGTLSEGYGISADEDKDKYAALVDAVRKLKKEQTYEAFLHLVRGVLQHPCSPSPSASKRAFETFDEFVDIRTTRDKDEIERFLFTLFVAKRVPDPDTKQLVPLNPDWL